MPCIIKKSGRSGVNKSDENHYPADDALIAADVILPAQGKLTWIGFKSAHKGKGYAVQTKCHALTGGGLHDQC
jgi:hypothetical protein